MSRLCLLVVALLALVVSCSKLDLEEAGYRNNIRDYDALIEKADPELKKAVEAKKKAYQEAYDKAPSDEENRVKVLAKLNETANKEIDQLETRVEKSNKKSAAADEKAMKEYQAKFVGTWEGDGMRLRIDEQGSVEYQRKSGGVEKSLDGASVKEFRRDAFDVSLLGIKTTFKIDEAPREDNGVWSVTIDGVKLYRVAGASGEAP